MNNGYEEYIDENSITWPLFFDKSVFKCENNADDINKVIRFVCDKLSFGYKSPFMSEFEPLFQFKDGRSTTYIDLDNYDFDFIKEVIIKTNNPYILAKCYEVLYLKHDEKKYAENAIVNFCTILNFKIKNKEFYDAIEFFQHILYLSKKVGSKKEVNSLIDKYILNINYDSASDFICMINSVFAFFKKCNYNKYDVKLIIDKISTFSFEKNDEYLELIKNIIDFYSSVKDFEKQNKWLNKFADVCEHLCLKYSPRGYRYISMAIDILSKQIEINEERINDLRYKLEKEQKNFFESLKFEEVKIDDAINEKFRQYISKINNAFENEKSSIGKFCCFLSYFEPIKRVELDKFSKDLNKSVFVNLTNQIIFNKDSCIIEEIAPNEDKKRDKYNVIQGMSFYHSIYYQIALCYVRNFQIDSDMEKLIEDIVSHNYLIPNERIDIVKKYLIEGLNKNVRLSVYHLTSQFEYGCARFLKEKRNVYPVITKGGMIITADLNHILTEKRFRDPISELVGDDLTLELQFLLIEPMYGNLRNRSYHAGYDKEEVCTNIELLSFFRILNAYCMAYDFEINNK